MGHSRYLPERMGTATISPEGAFEAGSFQSFTLVYTAGYFGIDDTGSLKIVHRFASDMGRPQFDDPKGWNYTTVEASNGAVLDVQYDKKRNIRPWDKTLFIRVVQGFLHEGDTITVRFGDVRHGSPGIRVQTFVEPHFEFKVLVDAFATYEYVELPKSPFISVVAGPPATYKAILPSLIKKGQPFKLGFKGEDKWGNPSDQVRDVFCLRSSLPVENMPDTIAVERGKHACIVGGLVATESGNLEIDVTLNGDLVVRSNPCRVQAQVAFNQYWADLHGQSEETIGTNTARDLMVFARDSAFLDAMSHQANDFQITTPFWHELNRLSKEFNKDGEFIMFPGYEWSGNTGLGGDRNVLYLDEDRPIHRSSHALVDDLSDIDTDANSADELFDALKNEDVVVLAHIGGRYADIVKSHNAQIERSIEIHSDWGTFEWLLGDAFEQGYRVGIVANSDGHKGRHGASHPGASLFGAYGGLTCLLATNLSRKSLAECLRHRRHYATTGCRAYLSVGVNFDHPAIVFSDDPHLHDDVARDLAQHADMGAVVEYDGDSVEFEFELMTHGPIECIEIRNRMDVCETYRPYSKQDMGRRVRIMWEGSSYRGRGRQTIWDGEATVEDNEFEQPTAINFWNLDKKLTQVSPQRLNWKSLTTGGFAGIDFLLRHPYAGTLFVDTPLVKQAVDVADIGLTPIVFENGGIKRRLSIYRLPDENNCRRAKQRVRVPLHDDRDNAIYLRATTEDGFFIYSSPVYVVRKKVL